MNFLKASPALLCLSFILLPLATADEHDDSAESETTEARDLEHSDSLEPVIVTGTLGPRTIGESLSSVTVIDEETLRRQAPSDMSQLLRGQPGVDLITNGSFGKNTSVFTRGTGSESTVLLVDGIRVQSASSGSAPWQYFPVDLLERVEIVRGPRSSLYGADAVGGVIQAFTLDPQDGQRGYFEGGVGNFNTQRASGGFSITGENTRFSLSGIHRQTDGTAIVEDGSNKGFRNTAGVARIAHDLNNGGQASAAIMQSGGNTEFEGGETDFTLRTLGLQVTAPVSDSWLSTVQFSEMSDEQDSVFEAFGDSTFDTRSRAARWENTLYGNVHEVAIGTELKSDELSSTVDYDETSRNNAAVFGQLRLYFGAADLQVALRADDNEAYGNAQTGGLALGYQLTPSLRARTSYGTSFRPPTFNDLFFPGFGNPDLEPETSGSLEAGLTGRYQNWHWDVAVYQLNIDNLIVGQQARENVSKARIRGVELSSGYSANQWDLGLTVTVQDPRVADGDNEGNRLIRRTKETARLDVDRQLGDFSLGGSLLASGNRYNDSENDLLLPGFVTANLRAGWSITDNWITRLTVDNVTNEQYTTACCSNGREYIAAGTTALASLRYEFR